MEPRKSTGESGPRPRVPRCGLTRMASRHRYSPSSSLRFAGGVCRAGVFGRPLLCLRSRPVPAGVRGDPGLASGPAVRPAVRGVRTSPGRTPPPVGGRSTARVSAGSLVVPARGVPAYRRPADTRWHSGLQAGARSEIEGDAARPPPRSPARAGVLLPCGTRRETARRWRHRRPGGGVGRVPAPSSPENFGGEHVRRSTRPVLKHGPRSLTRARVLGFCFH